MKRQLLSIPYPHSPRKKPNLIRIKHLENDVKFRCKRVVYPEMFDEHEVIKVEKVIIITVKDVKHNCGSAGVSEFLDEHHLVDLLAVLSSEPSLLAHHPPLRQAQGVGQGSRLVFLNLKAVILINSGFYLSDLLLGAHSALN